MEEAAYTVGDSFRIQFVWKIPNGDFIRAVFRAEVLHLDELSDKYVVLLSKFLAGRQESGEGEMRPAEEVDQNYWSLVAGVEGQRIAIAFEADDGRPLWLRLETLTGEHNFFRRLSELPEPFRDRREGSF